MKANMALKRQLDVRDLIIFESEMQWRTKSGPLAFILWATFGLLGAHHFYLGRWAAAIGQLVLTATVVVLYALALPMLLVGVSASMTDLLLGLASAPSAGISLRAVGMSTLATVLWFAMMIWWFVSVFFIPRSIRLHAYRAERALLEEMQKRQQQVGGATGGSAVTPAANAPVPTPAATVEAAATGEIQTAAVDAPEVEPAGESPVDVQPAEESPTEAPPAQEPPVETQPAEAPEAVEPLVAEAADARPAEVEASEDRPADSER